MVKPLLFYILLRPRPAPKRKGMIELSEETRDAEEATNTIAEVIDLGPLAYKAKTPGLDYGSAAVIPKAGDWVRFAKHAGHPFVIAGLMMEDSQKYVLVTDTDILCIIPPEEVERHRGWL